MGDMKRQHMISLVFLAVMSLWIGSAVAVCGFSGPGGRIPPSVVYERAEPESEISPDEHHEDRYLDWRASSHPRALP